MKIIFSTWIFFPQEEKKALNVSPHHAGADEAGAHRTGDDLSTSTSSKLCSFRGRRPGDSADSITPAGFSDDEQTVITLRTGRKLFVKKKFRALPSCFDWFLFRGRSRRRSVSRPVDHPGEVHPGEVPPPMNAGVAVEGTSGALGIEEEGIVLASGGRGGIPGGGPGEAWNANSPIRGENPDEDLVIQMSSTGGRNGALGAEKTSVADVPMLAERPVERGAGAGGGEPVAETLGMQAMT